MHQSFGLYDDMIIAVQNYYMESDLSKMYKQIISMNKEITLLNMEKKQYEKELLLEKDKLNNCNF